MPLSNEHLTQLSLMWGFWLWFSARRFIKIDRPGMLRAITLPLDWLVVFLHEATHALFALLTFRRILAFHVSAKGGYVQTEGQLSTRSVYMIAPMGLWVLAWWMATQLVASADGWSGPVGMGAAALIPILVLAGSLSKTDFDSMCPLGKFIAGYAYATLGVVLPASLAVGVFQQAW